MRLLDYRLTYYFPWRIHTLFYQLTIRPITRLIFKVRHGFYRHETWNLDYTCAKFMLPRLKYFRANLHGYPGDFDMETWKATVDKMIWSFQDIVNEGDNYCKWTLPFEIEHDIAGEKHSTMDYDKMRKNEARRQEGLKLFGEHLQGLWD